MQTLLIAAFALMVVGAPAQTADAPAQTLSPAQTADAPAQQEPDSKELDSLVLVQGGTFKNTKSQYYAKHVAVPDFYIGKYEVSQKEWDEVMKSNPSKNQGLDLPVDSVSWYDCVDYCNKRSVQEGLTPCYAIDTGKKDPANDNADDDLKWTVTVDPNANGYRLPTEVEWEYAAGGGQKSKSYTYSGSNDVDQVAWYWKTAGDQPLSGFWMLAAIKANHDQTQPVAGKSPGGSAIPNELGLYNMSGNVREWCWDWYVGPTTGKDIHAKRYSSLRLWKGGGWLGSDYCCATSFRGGLAANGLGDDTGFRLCRSKLPETR